MFILIIVLFGVVGIIQIPSLIKNRQWRELSAFSFFFIVGLTISLLQAFNIDVPNPLAGLKYFIENVLGLKY